MSTNSVLDLFQTKSHNPSFNSIKSSVKTGTELIDYCVPVNRYFPPAQLVDNIKENLQEILKYYPDYAITHQEYLSKLIDISPEFIVVANGSTEIITSLCEHAEGPILSPIPTFGRWTDLPFEFGKDVSFIQREKSQGFQLSAEEIISEVRKKDSKTLVICNPNNPTGAWFTGADIRKIITELTDLSLIIIDESFIDFSDLESASQLAIASNNTIVVKSMGKSLGWHGMRLGYAVTNKTLATKLRTRMPYWNINGLASYVLKNMVGLKDAFEHSFKNVMLDREYMYQRLKTIDEIIVYPSKGNFLYCELGATISGKFIRDYLLQKHGLIIRECSNKVGSTETYLRFSVNRQEETDRLISALRDVFKVLEQEKAPA